MERRYQATTGVATMYVDAGFGRTEDMREHLLDSTLTSSLFAVSPNVFWRVDELERQVSFRILLRTLQFNTAC